MHQIRKVVGHRYVRTVIVPAVAVAALVSGKSDILGLGRYC